MTAATAPGRSYSDEELRIAHRTMQHWRGCPKSFEAAIADEIWRRSVEGQAIVRRRQDAEWAAFNRPPQRAAAVQTPASGRPAPAGPTALPPVRSGKDAAANQGDD